MKGFFEIKKAKDGQFHFNLKAGNGEIILTSELYMAKASAEAGIASVRANSGKDDRYSKGMASNGKHYFMLKAANNLVIGNSQMYATASSRDEGIQSVKDNGAAQVIKDET